MLDQEVDQNWIWYSDQMHIPLAPIDANWLQSHGGVVYRVY